MEINGRLILDGSADSKDRFNVKVISLSGIAGEVGLENAAAAMAPTHICNADETGLFFNLMPHRHYVLPTKIYKTLGVHCSSSPRRI